MNNTKSNMNHWNIFDIETKKNICAYCNVPAELKCTGCYSNVYYCNRDHQKAHRRVHSTQCGALKLVRDDTLGRSYFVAMRNIECGEILLEEKEPLVIAPWGVPACLNCYVILTKQTSKPCKKCGWPLCWDCKGHGPECEITRDLMKNKIRVKKFGERQNVYKLILSMRSMALKKTNPSAYSKILELLNVNCDDSFLQPVYDMGSKILREDLMLNTRRDINKAKEIAKFHPVALVFNHEITIAEKTLAAVYHRVSYFKHDCAPNCAKTISSNAGISVWAVRPISKGEHVTICYIDALQHTIKRREILSELFINCECKRCQDPTEFGTMYNAVKCFEGPCDGYMIPPTFVTPKGQPMPDYVCIKCNVKMSWETTDEMIMKLDNELNTLITNHSEDVPKLKEFLEKQRKILSESHASIIDNKIGLAVSIGANSGKGMHLIPDEWLNEKKMYHEEIIEVLQLIAPSEPVAQGIHLIMLYEVYVEYARRNSNDQSIMHNVMEIGRELLTAAHALLRYESAIRPPPINFCLFTV